ncbi:IS110 family transposase [Marinoscillum sp. MHG1-6]|uniref:IS110 family transposase n=1 Tax=Marinoscillum sp. MHG1-6 TaxID=2959627 RepID=UPI0021579E27|nr:IS110 family transposase [Marinoscillum sp. MHG1-6]
MKKVETPQVNYPYVVGIDVSKESIDVCMIEAVSQRHYSIALTNTSEGYVKLKRWMKQHGNDDHEQTLFCMEHMGIYTRNLVKYLMSRGGKVWLESSLHIKRSIGLARGKSDKIDAERIARFALIHQQQAKLVKLSHPTLERLQYLMRLRARLLKSKLSQERAISEIEHFDKKAANEMKRLSKPSLEGLASSLKDVEEKMLEVIHIDKEVRALYELVTSVKCVGKVLATDLIIYTHGFTRMLDGKKLACYCGVAPFEYSSGTSVYGAPGTSNFANKILKYHLHMASMSAIRHCPELKEYYLRKREEGKGKMTILNAIRNKLLHRVVAVVKRGTPYQDRIALKKVEMA